MTDPAIDKNYKVTKYYTHNVYDVNDLYKRE